MRGLTLRRRPRPAGERSVIDDIDAAREQERPGGVFTPEAEQEVKDALADGIARSRRNLGAVFIPHVHPAPAPPTRPQPALPVNARTAPVLVATTDPGALAAAAGALRQVDFAAVDAAKKTEGATHAGVRQARGPVPFHDEILLAGRPPQDRPPVAEAARRHLDCLCYPPCGMASGAAYAELMRRVSEITRTDGMAPGYWPLPAIGGAL